MSPPPPLAAFGRDLLLYASAGLALAFLGPYGTALAAPGPRTAYWLIAVVAGGALGSGIDALLSPRLPAPLARALAVAALIAPAVAVLVLGLSAALMPPVNRPHADARFLAEVLAIDLLIFLARALLLRPPRVEVQTEVVTAPPLEGAEAALRARLAARLRYAPLLALEAEDHYVRVHTEAGSELLSLRFADALAEVAGAPGVQTHRSWWVAHGAIEGVAWRRGAGEVRLRGGLAAPVSRAHAPKLRALGWR